MKNNENLTTYQKLNRALNFGNRLKITDLVNPENIIIQADSREELHYKSLQQAQQMYLDSLFYKVTQDNYNRHAVAIANRTLAYYDYQAMETYPTIKAAMDLLAEETVCTGEGNSDILNIYSKNKRIKNILHDLFYNVLDINSNLYMWTRNTVKYGENFLYLHTDLDEGVVDVRQLNNFYMKREETVKDNRLETKFINGERNHEEYNIFQIAHFRLLSDDLFLPYGCSYFSGIRKIWRMLVQSEDHMQVYRLVRMSERNVFQVNVGNMNDNDAKSYMQKVASLFKKSSQINRDKGFVDYKYDPLAVEEDIFIPNRGIETIKIDKIAPAANLESIQDVEFLRRNLFDGLRIPKPFLSFDQAAGEGKSFAMMDMRFAKQIAKIQRTMVQELNKIAMVHLMILGLDEHLDDFKLTMNYPSIQAEIQRIERTKEQVAVYDSITAKNDGGWSAMSKTKAKIKYLGMTEDEIMDDLIMQRVERMLDQELIDTIARFKKTGIFSDIDKKYEDLNPEIEGDVATPDDNLPSGDESLGGEPSATPGTPETPAGGADNENPRELKENFPLFNKFIKEYLEKKELDNTYNISKPINNYNKASKLRNIMKKIDSLITESDDVNDI